MRPGGSESVPDTVLPERRRRFPQVPGRDDQSVRVIPEQADPGVASDAEETSDLTRVVAVVHVRHEFLVELRVADGAPTILALQHLLEITEAQTVVAVMTNAPLLGVVRGGAVRPVPVAFRAHPVQPVGRRPVPVELPPGFHLLTATTPFQRVQIGWVLLVPLPQLGPVAADRLAVAILAPRLPAISTARTAVEVLDLARAATPGAGLGVGGLEHDPDGRSGV